MAHISKTYRMSSRVLGLTVIVLLLTSSFIHSQKSTEQKTEIPEIAIKNLLMGLESENDGVRLSCAYFAGKYKITEVSPKLVEAMKESNNDELCRMLLWSLYQIGNDECCIELQAVMKDHSSKDLKKLCEYLHKIKEYETAIAKN